MIFWVNQFTHITKYYIALKSKFTLIEENVNTAFLSQNIKPIIPEFY